MITVQEAALESTFQKIARIIARRYGVTVSIRGGAAYVDMETMAIVLPSIAPGRDVKLEHLDGFLDHECAHVKFTEPGTLVAQPTLKAIWNVIEDVWVERAMGAEYYGCHQNLERTNKWLYASCEERWPQTDALGRLCYALERLCRGDYTKEQYADDPVVGSMIMQLQPEIDRGRICASTKEALSIAEAVLEKIKHLAEGNPTGGAGAGNGDESAGDDISGSGGQFGSDSGDKRDNDSEAEEKDGAGNPDVRVGAENQGRRKGQASDAGDQEGPTQAEISGPSEKDEGDEAQAQLKEAQEQAKNFLSQESGGGFDKPLDLEGLVNEHLTQFKDWSTEFDPKQYVVYSEDYDVEITYNQAERLALAKPYQELCNEVHRYVGNLATILELTLSAEAEDRWVGGARRGKKFDQRRLAHWAEGSDDDRLFRYMEQGVRHDTAISMLWDCSGSMGSASQPRNKAALARIAAVAFHEALKRCKSVAHEVLGFNTGGDYSQPLRDLIWKDEQRGEDLSRYSRLEELDNRMVFVPFGCDDGRPLVHITGGAANRDGECVLWAARRLAQRPEKRKILIVGSDGHPQGARYHKTEKEYLREVVLRVMAAGLEIYGVGIMSDAVRSYYPHYQVINDVQELPRAVMTLLTSSLPAQTRGRIHGVARL